MTNEQIQRISPRAPAAVAAGGVVPRWRSQFHPAEGGGFHFDTGVLKVHFETRAARSAYSRDARASGATLTSSMGCLASTGSF